MNQWHYVKDFKINELNICYNINGIIKINDDMKTVIFPEIINEIDIIDKEISKYANERKLSYDSLVNKRDNITVFEPFHVIFKKLNDGTKIMMEHTNVFVKDVIDKEDEESGEITIERPLKSVDSTRSLMNLRYWNNDYNVIFKANPRLIINDAEKKLKVSLRMREIIFIRK